MQRELLFHPPPTLTLTIPMNPRDEVLCEIIPLIRVYKDGRVERLIGQQRVPPSFDPATGVVSKDVVISRSTGVSVRLYLPSFNLTPNKLPVVVYYHGGSFCAFSAASPNYHQFANILAARANVIVVSVEYRLAPEHPIPTAYNDSWLALQWVLASGRGDWFFTEHGDMKRVFLAGDSTGGNISHHMAMRAKEAGVVLDGMIMVHPYFWGPQRLAVETEECESYVKLAMADSTWPLVCPGAVVGKEDVRLNPLAEGAPSLAGLGCRRVLVTVAEKDLLRDRGVSYVEALKASGWQGEAEIMEMKEEDHNFHLTKPGCEKALRQMEHFVAFLIKN